MKKKPTPAQVVAEARLVLGEASAPMPADVDVKRALREVRRALESKPPRHKPKKSKPVDWPSLADLESPDDAERAYAALKLPIKDSQTRMIALLDTEKSVEVLSSILTSLAVHKVKAENARQHLKHAHAGVRADAARVVALLDDTSELERIAKYDPDKAVRLEARCALPPPVPETPQVYDDDETDYDLIMAQTADIGGKPLSDDLLHKLLEDDDAILGAWTQKKTTLYDTTQTCEQADLASQAADRVLAKCCWVQSEASPTRRRPTNLPGSFPTLAPGTTPPRTTSSA